MAYRYCIEIRIEREWKIVNMEKNSTLCWREAYFFNDLIRK